MAKTAAPKNTKSTTPRTKRALKPVVVNHADMIASGGDDIDALLADLVGDPTAGTGSLSAVNEIIEQPLSLGSGEEILDTDQIGSDELDAIEAAPVSETPIAEEVELSDEEQAAVIGRVENVEAALEAASVQNADEAAAPTGDDSDIAPAAEAADTAPAKPKGAPRKHYTDKVERIKDRLGAAAGDFVVLTLDDAAVSDDELKNVMDSTFSILKDMNKKQQNRAGYLFDFLRGSSAKLSKVLEVTLQVLHRDGFVETGKTGNLMKELTEKNPYQVSTARAQSGNTVGMFADLKLLKQDGKGRFVGNPDSTLLAATNAKLGLVAAATNA